MVRDPHPADDPDVPGRFAWPPTPVAPAQEQTLTSVAGRESRQDLAAAVEIKENARSRARAVVLRRPAANGWRETLRSCVLDFECEWLGLVTPPWRDRAAESSWSPDLLSDYCPRCGGDVGGFEVGPFGPRRTLACSSCADMRLPWCRFVRAGSYQGVLRDAVHDAKFTGWHALAHDLGIELGMQIQDARVAAGVAADPAWLIPVPMHASKRYFTRSIDHARVLAQGAAITCGGVVRPLLKRTTWMGKSQLEVAPSARAGNPRMSMVRRGSFPSDALTDTSAPAGVASGTGITLILIDDVRTTGATLREAARALMEGVPAADRTRVRLWAAALAVTPESDRS